MVAPHRNFQIFIMLYQITLASICAGIVVEDGIIVRTAPVLAWMRLKRMEVIGRWVQSHRGTITRVT
jgi:hypothetical protein